MLRAVVAPISYPGRKGLRTHRSPAAIEKDGHRRRSTLKLLDPIQERSFISKGLGTASRELFTALEIEIGQLSEAIL
jgi:hypothetical protein